MPQESEAAAPRPELPMRLTRLRVKNFRSIADIDIPLSPLTVLVGPNGSGKSNVVDALRFVRDVFARGLDQAVMDREGMGVIQRWGTEDQIEIGFEVELAEIREQKNGEQVVVRAEPSTQFYYGFSFSSSFNYGAIVHHEMVSINVDSLPNATVVLGEEIMSLRYGEMESEKMVGFPSTKRLARQQMQGVEGLFSELSDWLFDDEEWVAAYEQENGYSWRRLGVAVIRLEKELKRLLFYTLNLADLRQPQQILQETPFDEKGRNLAAVIRQLLRANKLEWNGLRFALSAAVTGFQNIAIEPVGGYLATKLIYQTDNTQPRTSYIGQESDGTIRMLGLLAALYQDPAQPFLSIEEPEANIHPGALVVLASVLDEASLRSQILVTTHSPDMLDHLPAESFLVVEKVGDTTHVGPLDASQLASVRKRLFTPGELLRMEGLHRQTTPDSAA